MPESRLFMSSLSRRQLARRRPGRSLSAMLVGALLVVGVCVAAFLIARRHLIGWTARPRVGDARTALG